MRVTLERTCIDLAVFSPERLDFIAPPIVRDGLQYTAPKVIYKPGNYLDLSQLPKLTADQLKSVERLKADAKKSMEQASSDLKAQYRADLIQQGVDSGQDPKRAEAVVDEFIRTDFKELHGDFLLYFADGRTFTVDEVLANLEKFDNQALADPIEGTDYGRTTAKFYANNQEFKPFVNSFAHGGAKYFLKPSVNIIAAANGGFYPLDEPLIANFPHVRLTSTGKVRGLCATVENLEVLLAEYSISLKYDEILKKPSVAFPNDLTEADSLGDSAKFARLASLCDMNELPSKILDLFPALYAKHRMNPVLSWIACRPWDGVDRLDELFRSIHVKPSDVDYMKKVVLLWLVQCVAAVDRAQHSPIPHRIPKYESVLVFQGGQGVGKTKWIKSLVPLELRGYIRESAHLDVSDKDSVKGVISSWICELGELDSTFKKSEISQFKAFLSKESDSIRLPYDRCASEFARQTSFIGTVNQTIFLRDPTGARRFWPVKTLKLDPLDQNRLDLQQLWAQVYDLYLNGAAWWPDESLTREILERHSDHIECDWLEDLIAAKLNIGGDGWSSNVEIKEILNLPPATRGVNEILERLGAVKSKIRGNYGFNVTPFYKYGGHLVKI